MSSYFPTTGFFRQSIFMCSCSRVKSNRIPSVQLDHFKGRIAIINEYRITTRERRKTDMSIQYINLVQTVGSNNRTRPMQTIRNTDLVFLVALCQSRLGDHFTGVDFIGLDVGHFVTLGEATLDKHTNQHTSSMSQRMFYNFALLETRSISNSSIAGTAKRQATIGAVEVK